MALRVKARQERVLVLEHRHALGPPDFVHIPNVVRDGDVTFLANAPKLGGFLAVVFIALVAACGSSDRCR